MGSLYLSTVTELWLPGVVKNLTERQKQRGVEMKSTTQNGVCISNAHLIHTR